MGGKRSAAWLGVVAVCLLLASRPALTEPLPAVRQQQLLRMLRQDCGSCHGMTLRGGLGPALHAEAMRALPHSAIAAVIYHGRPGTPMPPWKTLLSAEEADWLAAYLQSDAALLAKDKTP
ncbi:cytochrome c [Paucibacter sp. APW11]|uniref:Cytochrome c n=1 Tax=Roseateles aquae TaxID=3077235 RepID=A0ABU3P655_9BURK|nr:cytochrome c [Paucibacter sp. APW11]MDT8998046.1 cytochrome c [Paucibacter sp. APW11]